MNYTANGTHRTPLQRALPLHRMTRRDAADVVAGMYADSCPLLCRLLDEGIAWIEPADEVVGTAADGVRVCLGSVFNRQDALNTESYLKAHPTPTDW